MSFTDEELQTTANLCPIGIAGFRTRMAIRTNLAPAVPAELTETEQHVFLDGVTVANAWLAHRRDIGLRQRDNDEPAAFSNSQNGVKRSTVLHYDQLESLRAVGARQKTQA